MGPTTEPTAAEYKVIRWVFGPLLRVVRVQREQMIGFMRLGAASLKAAFLVGSLTLGGCVPIPLNKWVAVPTDQANLPRDSERLIAAKDKVRVRYKSNGKTYLFVVDSVTPEGFIGTAEDKKRYSVKYGYLSFLEVQRVDWKFYGGGMHFL